MADSATADGADKRGIAISARVIPPPPTVSSEAQAFLSQPMIVGRGSLPDRDDKEGWRAAVKASDAMLTAMMAPNATRFPARVATHQVGQTPVHEIIPENAGTDLQDCALFHVHGGGYLYGGGMIGAYMVMPTAAAAGIRSFSVDYRMPPDHPFPAALDDMVAAYRWLLDRYKPEKIVVLGASAGGGLAAAFLLKARDLGLPLPAGCILSTPESDLTESGDTFETNNMIDNVLQHRLTQTIALYANGHDLRDPYLSPAFGDFSKGFPPTMLTSGTRDLFLSNTVILHRALLRAGCEAELHVWEAMPHGGFFGAPEDDEVVQEHARFIRTRLGTNKAPVAISGAAADSSQNAPANRRQV